MLKFELLKKINFSSVSEIIFRILANNMSKIAPTDNTYEEDYNKWFNAVNEGIKKENRNIILIYINENIIGFFQYYVTNEGLFMMEEIQISPIYQGKKYNVFRKLYGYIFTILPQNIESVEAFVNKKNTKSQEILKHLGLNIIDNSRNENNYHYRGKFKDLISWFKNID